MLKILSPRTTTQLLKSLKSRKKMKLFNVWSWPAEVIDDIRTWNIVRKALKEESTKAILAQFKYEIRTDKIGRLYTVINVPEEFYEEDKHKMVWAWMVEQLRELDIVLMQCQLNEFVYPEIERINDKDAFAYLVLLSPPTEFLSFWKFIGWIGNLGLYIGIFTAINTLVINYSGKSILDFIF
jgi:hypothetical protein